MATQKQCLGDGEVGADDVVFVEPASSAHKAGRTTGDGQGVFEGELRQRVVDGHDEETHGADDLTGAFKVNGESFSDWRQVAPGTHFENASADLMPARQRAFLLQRLQQRLADVGVAKDDARATVLGVDNTNQPLRLSRRKRAPDLINLDARHGSQQLWPCRAVEYGQRPQRALLRISHPRDALLNHQGRRRLGYGGAMFVKQPTLVTAFQITALDHQRQQFLDEQRIAAGMGEKNFSEGLRHGLHRRNPREGCDELAHVGAREPSEGDAFDVFARSLENLLGHRPQRIIDGDDDDDARVFSCFHDLHQHGSRGSVTKADVLDNEHQGLARVGHSREQLSRTQVKLLAFSERPLPAVIVGAMLGEFGAKAIDDESFSFWELCTPSNGGQQAHEFGDGAVGPTSIFQASADGSAAATQLRGGLQLGDEARLADAIGAFDNDQPRS